VGCRCASHVGFQACLTQVGIKHQRNDLGFGERESIGRIKSAHGCTKLSLIKRGSECK
jgi:hypothetical protein